MMTDQQINWAKTHDWFIAVLANGQGILALDVAVDKNGNIHTDSVAFTNYRALRNWAGY